MNTGKLNGILIALSLALSSCGGAGSSAASSTATQAPAAGSQGARLLPSGYLSVRRSQLIDTSGNPVRIASVGWQGTNSIANAPIGLWSVNYKATMDAMVSDGFNAVRISWTDAGLHSTATAANIDATQNPDLAGLTQMQVLDKIVGYAGTIGLKIIFDHHDDEGISGGISSTGVSCVAQQDNGLWFDLGPGTDNTDGCGDPGTVTAAQFQADWVELAQRYAANSTVIGFDIDNEPFYTASNGLNWGAGGPTDLHAMYTSVGDAIQSVDPGALIICEGAPLSAYGASDPAIGTWVEDLRPVLNRPVVLGVPNKVVYSVHLYPNEVTSSPDADSGPTYIQHQNAAWGYLETQDIAPVWIGEMGAPLTASDTDGQAWAATIIPYLNGLDGSQGGPTFAGTSQPVSTDWWFWGTYNQGTGWGTLAAWNPATYKPGQQAATSQLQWR